MGGRGGVQIIPSRAGEQKMGPHLVWEAVRWGWLDVGNEGRVSDVLVITDDMHSVLPRLRGPVPHVTGAIALVIAFDFGLRGSLNGEAWVRGGEGQRALEAAWTPCHSPSNPSPVVPMSISLSHPNTPQRSCLWSPVIPKSPSITPLPSIPSAATQSLTQCPHLRANGFHHKVS